MRPFRLDHAPDAPAAVRLAAGAVDAWDVQFIAGGTTLLDLMKLGSITPAALIDIAALDGQHGRIDADERGLRLGALVRMAQAAEDPRLQRDYPVIAESLMLAASPQLRNMASLGGNVLQRTRCQYFRDPSWAACNKRMPGSGCAALDGVNRKHAVLGVSDRCIAAYPGDFATALVALEAAVETLGPDGPRSRPLEQLHGHADHPERETVLAVRSSPVLWYPPRHTPAGRPTLRSGIANLTPSLWPVRRSHWKWMASGWCRPALALAALPIAHGARAARRRRWWGARSPGTMPRQQRAPPLPTLGRARATP